MVKKLRASVIGAGYLGKFHAEKYAALDNVELIGVVDVDRAKTEEIATRFKVPAFTDYRELLRDLDLVSIVVPTDKHYAIAKDCLEHGIHVFVEKPITQTVAEAQELVELSRARELTLQVGHIERFNPAIIELHRVIHNPLFIETHRLSPFKTRGTDVDVVLDLMIHDIDLILSLVASEITEVRSIGYPVLTNEVDIANARFEFANGCVANVTASRVSQKVMRKLRVFQSDAYISVDTQENKISIGRKREGESDAPALVEAEEKSFGAQDSLLLEIKAFVDAVKNRTAPIVSGLDGKRALEIALLINREMSKSRAARAIKT